MAAVAAVSVVGMRLIDSAAVPSDIGRSTLAASSAPCSVRLHTSISSSLCKFAGPKRALRLQRTEISRGCVALALRRQLYLTPSACLSVDRDFVKDETVISEVTVHYLQDLLHSEQPPVLIDVRNPDEFAEGHAPGAINVPLPELESAIAAHAIDLPDREEHITVICRSGKRSMKAAHLLCSNFGYRHVVNIMGGTMAWIAEGYPVEL